MNSHPLTPQQIEETYLSRTGQPIRVVMYDNIIDSGSIEEVFKGDTKVILFYPALRVSMSTLGHYTGLLRNGNTIYYYDPLGYTLDEYKKFAFNRNELYNERLNSLTNLLLNSNYKIDYNSNQHQSRRSNVSTCGLHCMLRCMNSELSNEQYHKVINNTARGRGRLRDNLVKAIFAK